MKPINKILPPFFILSGLVLTGCSTNQEKDYVSSNDITVERADSKKARIALLNVTAADNWIEIRGEVRRRSNLHGSIPGHIDIELIGDDGQTISKSYTEYSRRNHRTRTAEFSIKLDTAVKENYTVRVAHHYPAHNSYYCCHSAEAEK